MPSSQVVNVLTSDDKVKAYTIRTFVPLRVQDMVSNLMREGHIDEGNRIYLREMTLEPTKLTDDFLKSDECDSFEMQQLIAIFGAMSTGMPLKEFLLLPEDQRVALMLERREKRIEDLKKKHT